MNGPRATGGRGRSANFSKAMKNSAERRRCPKCERKSALVRVSVEYGSITYCRWDDCDYERVYDRWDRDSA